ncbi:MAG: hypothetical protein J2P33_03390 [Actinobacteria bacterium]|nr:hypothetical protein [Actinomycetota bacterium]
MASYSPVHERSGAPSVALRNGRWRRPGTWLIAVAVLHGVSPLIILGPGWYFGVDETIYLSQINAYTPAIRFSAPRARGVTLLAAPVTELTDSTTAVRLWLALLSAIALYLAFRPWLRLRPGFVVPLAALLFSTIWTVIYYGFEVMPNYWVAVAAVAACGYALRFVVEGRSRQLIALALAMAIVALLRPSDALYGGFALVLCCLFIRGARRRRVGAAAAVVIGSGLGALEWVVEAYTRFGGLPNRIDLAQAANGGPGPHFAVLDQWRTLAGPLLCRTGCQPGAPFLYQWWWLVLTALVVLGIAYSRRARELALDLVPALVGLVMAAQYFFGVSYSAPRFLIPAYALLSLPAASGVMRLVRSTRPGTPRFALQGALVLVLLLHAAIQLSVITRHIAPSARDSSRVLLADAEKLASVGLRHPCIVRGKDGMGAPRLAYATRCANVPAERAALRDRLEAGAHVIWPGTQVPSRYYGVTWKRVTLPLSSPEFPRTVYLSRERLRLGH